MNILQVLTYYRPHTSGLTIYVERLSRTLVKFGHEVTILTSQYDSGLPRVEMIDGVKIIRIPVLFRISKGVIMPMFGFTAWKLVFENDVIHLHLPQFDAAGVALRGRILKKPTVISYHSDLLLPPGVFNRFVNVIVSLMNNLTAIFGHVIGAYTSDFAEHSPFLKRYKDKVRVILPPVILPEISDNDINEFKQKHNPKGKHPVIGMATRFAAEKGVEILLEALPRILDHFPDALVLYAGQYKDVWKEKPYLDRLMPVIKDFQNSDQWKFVGNLSLNEMAAYYPNLDILVVPSLNSTETFGLVQIEAMLKGVPTVASNLPGVRQPPRITRMGDVIPVGDSKALAEAVIRVLENADLYKGDPSTIARMFDPDTNAKSYNSIYQELIDQYRLRNKRSSK